MFYLKIVCYENDYNCQSIFFFRSEDLITSFSTLLTFYFRNSKNFNVHRISNFNFNEILFTARLHKIEFLHPWKSNAQNGRSDSTPRILTSWKGQSLPIGRGRSCGPAKKVRAPYMFLRILNFLFDFLRKSCLFDKNNSILAFYNLFFLLKWKSI